MTDVSRWASHCQDTVTIEPFTSASGGNNPSYGTAVTYRARCVGKIRRITDATGQERVSSVTTYLMAAPTTLTPRDRITLPAHFVPRQPKILSVGLTPDDSGLHHAVVYT